MIVQAACAIKETESKHLNPLQFPTTIILMGAVLLITAGCLTFWAEQFIFRYPIQWLQQAPSVAALVAALTQHSSYSSTAVS